MHPLKFTQTCGPHHSSPLKFKFRKLPVRKVILTEDFISLISEIELLENNPVILSGGYLDLIGFPVSPEYPQGMFVFNVVSWREIMGLFSARVYRSSSETVRSSRINDFWAPSLNCSLGVRSDILAILCNIDTIFSQYGFKNECKPCCTISTLRFLPLVIHFSMSNCMRLYVPQTERKTRLNFRIRTKSRKISPKDVFVSS